MTEKAKQQKTISLDLPMDIFNYYNTLATIKGINLREEILLSLKENSYDSGETVEQNQLVGMTINDDQLDQTTKLVMLGGSFYKFLILSKSDQTSEPQHGEHRYIVSKTIGNHLFLEQYR